MKSITENLALVSLLGIALAFFRLNWYYNYFNINIASYIDVTEVLQLDYFFLVIIALIASNAIVFLFGVATNKLREFNFNTLVGHVSVVLFEAKKEVVDEQSDEAVV